MLAAGDNKTFRHPGIAKRYPGPSDFRSRSIKVAEFRMPLCGVRNDESARWISSPYECARRYCTASAKCSRAMRSLPARSAMVRATHRTRW